MKKYIITIELTVDSNDINNHPTERGIGEYILKQLSLGEVKVGQAGIKKGAVYIKATALDIISIGKDYKGICGL